MSQGGQSVATKVTAVAEVTKAATVAASGGHSQPKNQEEEVKTLSPTP